MTHLSLVIFRCFTKFNVVDPESFIMIQEILHLEVLIFFLFAVIIAKGHEKIQFSKLFKSKLISSLVSSHCECQLSPSCKLESPSLPLCN